MSQAAPPVNVRLEMFDGRVLAVDTVYVGIDETGTHNWAIVNGPAPEDVKHMHIDELPAFTGVTLVEGYEP